MSSISLDEQKVRMITINSLLNEEATLRVEYEGNGISRYCNKPCRRRISISSNLQVHIYSHFEEDNSNGGLLIVFRMNGKIETGGCFATSLQAGRLCCFSRKKANEDYDGHCTKHLMPKPSTTAYRPTFIRSFRPTSVRRLDKIRQLEGIE